MKTLILLILFGFSFPAVANINYIYFYRIPDVDKHVKEINFLKENEQYFNKWYSVWPFTVSKEDVKEQLINCYNDFSKTGTKNVDLLLLLGDISHYLYNLDETEYFQIAVSYYKEAIKYAPKDYRSYWFLGNHYALSAMPYEGMKYFLKAKKLLPENPPYMFWDEYAFTAYGSAMPSNAVYAMNKVKQITGREGNFEKIYGQFAKELFIPVNIDSTYDKFDTWGIDLLDDNTGIVISRQLGIKFSIDLDWGIDFTGFNHILTFCKIDPPPITDKYGTTIHYTMGIMAHVQDEGETLEDYAKSMMTSFKAPKKIKSKFRKKYPGMIVYEIKQKDIYENIGGAHMINIFIARDFPAYPGLSLEIPQEIKFEETNQNQYVSLKPVYNRAKATIFYFIFLDTAENIYKDAYKLFKKFFDKQLTIE